VRRVHCQCIEAGSLPTGGAATRSHYSYLQIGIVGSSRIRGEILCMPAWSNGRAPAYEAGAKAYAGSSPAAGTDVFPDHPELT
jgi:hypothetical protein